MRLPDDLIDLARTQLGLFTRAQARASGVNDRSLRRWCAAGKLWSPAPRVLAETTTDLSRERRWRAHALSVDPKAVLCRATAAAVHGLPVYVDDATPTHVLTWDRSGTAPPGALLHRSGSFTDEQVETAQGLLVTNVARTVVDLASDLTRWQLGKVVRHVVRAGSAPIEAIHGMASAVGPVAGTIALREVLAELTPAAARAASELESIFLVLVQPHGLEPTHVNLAVTDADGRARVLDAAYLPQRVAVELDGRQWHGLAIDRDEDARRQNALVLAGWTVLRFTWDDLTLRPEHVIATIRAALSGSCA